MGLSLDPAIVQELGIIGKIISSVNKIIFHLLDLVTEIANTSESTR